MMRSFYNGVSGVKTHSYGMDLLANNISNINTAGFKAAVPEFKDMFYQTGLDVGGLGNFGANQVGLAAAGLSSAFSQKQGFLAITDNVFDVALEGKGFYGITDTDGQTHYTRNGAFDIDRDGFLVDSFGRYVQGTMNAGFALSPMNDVIQKMYGKTHSNEGYTISNNDLDITLNPANMQGRIHLPNTLYMKAEVTTNISIKANISNEIKEKAKYIKLDNITVELSENGLGSVFKASNLEPNARIFLSVDRGSGKETIEAYANEFGELNKEISGTVRSFTADQVKMVKEGVLNKFNVTTYDEDGSERTMVLELRATDSLNFEGIARLVDSNGNVLAEQLGNVEFNPDGSLKSNSLNQVGGISLDLGSPRVDGKGGYDGLNIKNETIERHVSANGYPAGILTGWDIDIKGNILANFSNGKSQGVAKLAVFNFINEQGLTKQGENEFKVSADSGKPMFFYDNEGNVVHSYKVKSYFLEQSNVDLGTELTQVIAFQKAYEANAKSITTADQMLKRAIEMKK